MNWESTPPSYLDRMLRLVYPFNILNAQHLAQIIVDQLPLREWIQADPERGTLTQAGINNWLWEVPPERLIDLNNHLGQQGVLIAWQAPPPPPKKPRLP